MTRYQLFAIITCIAAIAQLVERIHGKDEVSGSNPDRGSKLEEIRKLSPERAVFSLVARSANQGFFRGEI